MEQLRRIAWVPVLWGVLTDVFLSQLMGLGVSVAVGIDPDTDAALAESLLRASPLFWPAFVLGIAFSGLGGYLAGRLARREGAFHGTLTAFISNIVFSLLLGAPPSDTLTTLGLMLAILAGTLGGWIATRGMPLES